MPSNNITSYTSTTQFKNNTSTLIPKRKKVIDSKYKNNRYESNAVSFANPDYSFELLKEATQSELARYYSFKNQTEIINFLIKRVELTEFLVDIHSQILILFGTSDFKLELELFIEEENWETLFINIYNNLEILDAKSKIDYLLDWIIDKYDNLYEYINISNNLFVNNGIQPS